MSRNNQFIIIQLPNKYLWIMIGSWLVGWFAQGVVFPISRTVLAVAGIIWAYEEITNGVNWFRKVLGLVVLIVISYGVFKAMV